MDPLSFLKKMLGGNSYSDMFGRWSRQLMPVAFSVMSASIVPLIMNGKPMQCHLPELWKGLNLDELVNAHCWHTESHYIDVSGSMAKGFHTTASGLSYFAWPMVILGGAVHLHRPQASREQHLRSRA